MKEFLTTLGLLLIAFGAVKLVIALIQKKQSANQETEVPEE